MHNAIYIYYISKVNKFFFLLLSILNQSLMIAQLNVIDNINYLKLADYQNSHHKLVYLHQLLRSSNPAFYHARVKPSHYQIVFLPQSLERPVGNRVLQVVRVAYWVCWLCNYSTYNNKFKE